MTTPELAVLRADTLRDLDWLIECAEDYRRGLTGRTCSHSLQDIELVVKTMRERFTRHPALANQANKEEPQ